MAGDGEKMMCTSQTEEETLNHLIVECVATAWEFMRAEERKNKREGGGMVKRLGKEEENKNIRCIE